MWNGLHHLQCAFLHHITQQVHQGNMTKVSTSLFLEKELIFPMMEDSRKHLAEYLHLQAVHLYTCWNKEVTVLNKRRSSHEHKCPSLVKNKQNLCFRIELNSIQKHKLRKKNLLLLPLETSECYLSMNKKVYKLHLEALFFLIEGCIVIKL